METLEKANIQGLLASGYGKLPYACFVLLAVGPSPGARAWLRELLTEIDFASSRPTETAINIAFTYHGLAAIGLDADSLQSFPAEFVEGMTTQHRQNILGDVGDSTPWNWQWGGPQNPVIHGALFLYAKSVEALESLYQKTQAGFLANGISEIQRLNSAALADREHFGFRDGISQPRIQGMSEQVGIKDAVPAGEFILGYKNAYSQYPDSPSAKRNSATSRGTDLPGSQRHQDTKDLGRNSSYAVFRQLEQNVPSFWRFMREQAQNDADAIRIASKAVGRWPSGAPLVLSPNQDDPALSDANGFTYSTKDADGMACPFGAHIRRTNPRDAIEQTEVKLATEIVQRHRILRRGRSYGPPFVPTKEPQDMLTAVQSGATDDNEARGLMFICLNANIQRQFEFIQHTWCNNPKFEALYDEVDVITGAATLGSDNHFSIPGVPIRERLSNLPRFTRVLGGAYFFLPGGEALRYLANLAV